LVASEGLALSLIFAFLGIIALTLLTTPFFIYAIKRIFGITGQKYNFEASHPGAHKGSEY